MQNLRGLLNAGGQEALDELPDGIHSGLVKPGARGIFFYFQAVADTTGRRHFWKYYDVRTGEITDNRFVIASLLFCTEETPRVIDADLAAHVFEIQEKVITDVLRGDQQQRALEIAPRTIDPVQQSLATTLQGYLHRPDLDRGGTLTAIRFLNQPKQQVQLKKLRELQKDVTRTGDVKALLAALDDLRPPDVADPDDAVPARDAAAPAPLTREDLKLIGFEYVS